MDEPMALKMMDTLSRMRARYALEKQNKMCVKFLEKPPVNAVRELRTIARCQAINLNNKPCQFKAMCGKFCKRHVIVEGDMIVGGAAS